MYGQVFYSGEILPDLSEDFCQAIIELANNIAEQESKVHGGGEEVRNNSIFPIGDDKFKSLIYSWVEKANIETGWWFDLIGLEHVQLSK